MTNLAPAPCIALVALALMAATATTAVAGMDVDLEREFQRLSGIRAKVAELPAYRESEDLRQQVEILGRRLEELASGSQPDETSVERESLRKQIDTLQLRLADLAKMIVDFREQISSGENEQFFPGVRHRIAAFTFDDPHQTGLGDPVSFLLAKKLLFSTRVSSFAIVNYRQGAERDTSSGLAYFDRVDALTDAQGFLLALWGRVSPTNDGARIDSYLQVPADADDAPYVRTIRLPEAMGSGALTARLKPDRIQLQSLVVTADQIGMFEAAAAQVATLRAEPSAESTPTGRLDEGKPYRIVDSNGEWIRLRFDDGVAGWTSVDAFCKDICRELLDVAIYTNDIVALTSGLSPRPPPPSVTREAAAVTDQLAAIVAAADDPRQAVDVASRWAERSPTEGGALVGGTGFANLLAAARVSAALDAAGGDGTNFDSIRLDRSFIATVANDLAVASVHDPGDIDVVENLAVLFAYLGDDRRRELALDIAAGLKAR
jgi:hypothetical protein